MFADRKNPLTQLYIHMHINMTTQKYVYACNYALGLRIYVTRCTYACMYVCMHGCVCRCVYDYVHKYVPMHGCICI